MALTSTVLTSTVSNIFVSQGSSAITAMYLCNTGNVTAYFTLYAVPSGNNASENNAIYYQVPVVPNDTYVIDNEKLILDNGDSIKANLALGNGIIKIIATVSSIGI